MTETHIPAGRDNLRYLGGGTRFYGQHPVLARTRGVWEVEFVFSGAARPSGVADVLIAGPRLHLARPESAHGWIDDTGGASEVWVLHFAMVPSELAAAMGWGERRVWALDAAAGRRFRAFGREMREARFWTRPEASARVTAILAEITTWVAGRQATELAESNVGARVERCLHWYRERLTEAPGVAALARVAGCSGTHLRRLFAEAGRGTPHEEMARLRIEAAEQCLREGWSQAAVAEQLGFSEVSAFARAYRRVTGRPPGRSRGGLR